ncbi:hypothetical protein, partial [Paraburkholderia sp. RL17-347-BIC-D]|uniref:hypothetical protein n=1 Tax=Paraburkholderia sp. RL17-347-BIC-D TaxID=3031632 RepID=UPI0038BDB3F9
IGAEAGLYPYRPNWDVTVYNWAPGPGVPTSTIHADTPHAWQLGKVVGVSVGRSPLSLTYQHYWLPTRYDSMHSPAIWSGADVLMVKYRF